MQSSDQGRPTCLDCFRPEALCYCAYVKKISTRTKIEILQHPREAFHPLNTARLVERSLTNSIVYRGDLASLRKQVLALPHHPRRFLLFPSQEARDVRELDQTPDSVMVLDGTWPMARALLREIPELSRLPHVRLTPTAPSRYRIRRPPKFEALSTLESIGLLLSELEPELDLSPLILLFEKMIDLNIEARVPSESGARFKRRALRPHRFPELLAKSADAAVIVVAEGLWPSGEARQIVAAPVSAEIPWNPIECFETTHIQDLFARLKGDEVLVTWQSELARALKEHGQKEVLSLRGVAADYLAHLAKSQAGPAESLPPRPRLGTLTETLAKLGRNEPPAGDRVTLRLRASEALWRHLLHQSRLKT